MFKREHNLAGIHTVLESDSIDLAYIEPPELIGMSSEHDVFATAHFEHRNSEGRPRAIVKDDLLQLEANAESYANGTTLYYLAELAAERARQLKGGVMMHAASTYLPDQERGVLVLGQKGAGKTSTVASLCLNHGAELIGNDQVILGLDEVDGISLVDGTKILRIRKTAALQDETLSKLTDFLNDDNPVHWDNKIEIDPENAEIDLAMGAKQMTDIVQVIIDRTVERTHVKHAVADIQTTLFLSEIVSRHIRGVATPIIDRSDRFEGFAPSMDSQETANNRASLVQRMLGEYGVRKIYAPSTDHVVDEILSHE